MYKHVFSQQLMKTRGHKIEREKGGICGRVWSVETEGEHNYNLLKEKMLPIY